jgi:L-fucose isomerase-like protein
VRTAFAYDVAASTLHDEASTARILAAHEQALTDAGGVRRAFAEAPHGEPLFHVVLTGGTERVVLERIERRRAHVGREPVVLVAHPHHNSLPASLEILARVRRDGGVGRIVFLTGDTAADRERLAQAATLAAVPLGLRLARIGAIGGPSDWLAASAHDAATVRASWGPEIVPLSLEPVFEQVSANDADRAQAREFAERARGCREPDLEAVAQAMAVYRALREVVDAQRLDALTVRCFELVVRERTTSCIALSRLCDEGVPAGCEGDVPSVLGLLWLYRLTGQMPWMANPSRIDLSTGEILLAHCTVPCGRVGSFELRSHFESGQGVAISGELASGPVTLVRIGGERLEAIWTCEGELVASEVEEGLCRTQARIRTDGSALADVLERPLGNHLIVLRGHQAELARASRRFVLGRED